MAARPPSFRPHAGQLPARLVPSRTAAMAPVASGLSLAICVSWPARPAPSRRLPAPAIRGTDPATSSHRTCGPPCSASVRADAEHRNANGRNTNCGRKGWGRRLARPKSVEPQPLSAAGLGRELGDAGPVAGRNQILRRDPGAADADDVGQRQIIPGVLQRDAAGRAEQGAGKRRRQRT